MQISATDPRLEELVTALTCSLWRRRERAPVVSLFLPSPPSLVLDSASLLYRARFLPASPCFAFLPSLVSLIQPFFFLIVSVSSLPPSCPCLSILSLVSLIQPHFFLIMPVSFLLPRVLPASFLPRPSAAFLASTSILRCENAS
ncbi:hypothetical protein E2C01_072932 [Portunus trituberculatus]|uniref:Transmembrane protein n=1 Tax=Portunus trituberculatus TaxID=210409 RepID=A0A5B7I8H8_PORTR|nr:hypothetical protein [Portunus trituberculatus]